MTYSPHNRGMIAFAIFLLAFCLIIYFFGAYILPIIFCGILTIAFLPMQNKLEGWGVSRSLSSIIIVVSSFIFLALIVFGLYSQIGMMVTDLDITQENTEELVEDIEQELNVEIQQSTWNEYLISLKNNAGTLLKSGGSFFEGAFSTFSGLLSFLIFVPVCLVFMLIYRDRVSESLLLFDGGKYDHRSLLEDIKSSIGGYAKGLGLVILIVAVLNSIGLFAIGVDFAIALGVISATTLVIPYIGVLLGALPALVVVLVTKEGWTYPLLVIGLFGLVQFIEGNFITPRLMGHQINVNPLAVFLGVIAAGYLGGILGVVIAVPVMAILKCITGFYPSLKPISRLLR